MGSLTPLRFGRSKTNEAIPLIVFDSEMAFVADGINELFEIRCAHVLFCDPDGSAFADDNDLDLPRVLHLALNAVSDIVS